MIHILLVQHLSVSSLPDRLPATTDSPVCEMRSLQTKCSPPCGLSHVVKVTIIVDELNPANRGATRCQINRRRSLFNVLRVAIGYGCQANLLENEPNVPSARSLLR